jgi:hypothetical protein
MVGPVEVLTAQAFNTVYRVIIEQQGAENGLLGLNGVGNVPNVGVTHVSFFAW